MVPLGPLGQKKPFAIFELEKKKKKKKKRKKEETAGQTDPGKKEGKKVESSEGKAQKYPLISLPPLLAKKR